MLRVQHLFASPGLSVGAPRVGRVAPVVVEAAEVVPAGGGRSLVLEGRNQFYATTVD